MPTTLSEIWLSVGPIFTVLLITPSFLVRFLPVKYGIEALDIPHTLVKEWSVRSGSWSGQRLGQTSVKLGQPWSNLVKLGQSSPNSGKCIPDHVLRVFGYGAPQSGQKRLGQPSVKLWSTFGQTWSTLVNLVEIGQTSSNSGKCAPDSILGSF